MYCIKLPFIALNYRTVHNFTVHLMPRKVLELNPFTNTRRITHVIQAFNERVRQEAKAEQKAKDAKREQLEQDLEDDIAKFHRYFEPPVWTSDTIAKPQSSSLHVTREAKPSRLDNLNELTSVLFDAPEADPQDIGDQFFEKKSEGDDEQDIAEMNNNSKSHDVFKGDTPEAASKLKGKLPEEIELVMKTLLQTAYRNSYLIRGETIESVIREACRNVYPLKYNDSTDFDTDGDSNRKVGQTPVGSSGQVAGDQAGRGVVTAGVFSGQRHCNFLVLKYSEIFRFIRVKDFT